MTSHFRSAAWSTSLKVVSLLGTIMLCGVSYAAYRSIPTSAGFTRQFGLTVALIPLIVLLASFLSIVRGYTVEFSELSVKRLLTTTRIPLMGLTHLWADTTVCKGSVRVFGNGGLFSFSGWFYSRRLGRYRLFATDFRNAVVLQFSDRAVVVSPEVPQAFIDHLCQVIPGLHVGPEESDS